MTFSGSVRRDGDRALVTVSGGIDVDNLSQFSDLMTQAVSLHAESVTVDVAALTHLDSQALHVFVSTAELVRITGAKLDVQAASPRLYRIFKITGLLEVLQVAQPAVVPPAPGLAAMVAALNAVPRTRDVLDTALHQIARTAQAVVVGADGASITVPRNGRLGTVAASNNTVLDMDHDQYDTGEGPCLDAATQGRRFHIDTLSAETRWPAFVPRAQARGIHSILSTPLAVRGAPAGALNIYSRVPGVFTSQDNQWADTFADLSSALLTAAEENVAVRGLQAQVSQALLSREVIALAQGVVMQRDGVSAEAAHAKMRDISRTTGATMRALSEELVSLRAPSAHEPGEVSPTWPSPCMTR